MRCNVLIKYKFLLFVSLFSASLCPLISLAEVQQYGDIRLCESIWTNKENLVSNCRISNLTSDISKLTQDESNKDINLNNEKNQYIAYLENRITEDSKFGINRFELESALNFCRNKESTTQICRQKILNAEKEIRKRKEQDLKEKLNLKRYSLEQMKILQNDKKLLMSTKKRR